MYYKGPGMDEDILRAQMWFTITSLAGYEKALNDMDNLNAKLTPKQQDEVQMLVQECVVQNYQGC